MGTPERLQQGIRGAERGRARIGVRPLIILLYEIYEPKSDKARREIPYAVCLVDKEFRGNSYREHVSYLGINLGSLHGGDLQEISSKSCLRVAAKRPAKRWDLLMRLASRQAGDDACGSPLGSASGLSINIYADWETPRVAPCPNASSSSYTYWQPPRRDRRMPDNPGHCPRLPRVQEDVCSMPNGEWHVMPDSAHGAHENCKVICDSGRKPAA